MTHSVMPTCRGTRRGLVLWAVRAAFRACAEDRPLDGGGVRGRAQNSTEGRGLCWAWGPEIPEPRGESRWSREDRQLEGC